MSATIQRPAAVLHGPAHLIVCGIAIHLVPRERAIP
jgi:hypothetical protein